MKRPHRPGRPHETAPAMAERAIMVWQLAEFSRRERLERRHGFGGVLAEGVGFEPTVGLHPRRFSRPLP